MTLRKISFIFFKSFIAWLIILAIFFYDIKSVNLDNDYNTPSHIKHFYSKPKINTITKVYSCVGKNYSNNHNNKLINKTNNTIISQQQKKEKGKIIFERKKYLLNIVNNLLNNNHGVANLKKVTYKKLCNYYPGYCSIIDVSKIEFTKKERLYFTALTIYLLRYLEDIFPDIKKDIYYLKIQKEKIGRRGYSGHHSIVMNIKKDMTYKQFFEVLTHEMGHLVDLGFIKGTSWSKDNDFTEFGKKSFAIDDKSILYYKLSWKSEKIKNSYTYAKDFVSGYGLTDPFEDFAESFNMYINHNRVFIKMTKESNILEKKYNYLNTLLKGKYIYSDKKYNYKSGFRPRDTTRLR